MRKPQQQECWGFHIRGGKMKDYLLLKLLRHCRSRGASSAIKTTLKVLGLNSRHDCLPYNEEDSGPIIAPQSSTQSFECKKKSPINILYLIHQFYPEGGGGTEFFLEQLSAKQVALGNKVKIVSLSTGFSYQYPERMKGLLGRSYKWKGVDVLAIRYQKPQKGLYFEKINQSDPIQEYFAKWCFEEFKPDLVHAVYPQPFATFLRVCREESVPYIITATDFSAICPKGTLMESDDRVCQGSQRGRRCRSDRTRFEQAEQMLCGAEFVAVPSEFSAKRLTMEIPKLQSIIIPHQIEDIFNYRYRTKIQHFAFFASLTWAKGVLLLVKAFKKLEGDFTLDIYGEGPLELFLKKYCLNDHRIHLRGNVSRQEIPSCYDSADCVVIPSRTVETYSLVLSEALASGCMVIASDLGALPQRSLESGGRIFRSGDSDELLGALKSAIKSPAFPLKKDVNYRSEYENYETLYRKAVKK